MFKVETYNFELFNKKLYVFTLNMSFLIDFKLILFNLIIIRNVYKKFENFFISGSIFNFQLKFPQGTPQTYS